MLRQFCQGQLPAEDFCRSNRLWSWRWLQQTISVNDQGVDEDKREVATLDVYLTIDSQEKWDRALGVSTGQSPVGDQQDKNGIDGEEAETEPCTEGIWLGVHAHHRLSDREGQKFVDSVCE